jgi:hypothetical protein
MSNPEWDAKKGYTRGYQWIIKKDHLADLTKPEGTNDNATGLTGPREAAETVPPSWIGHEFRMYDDDGILYYTGMLYFDPKYEDKDPEVWFRPLEDFGEPNAGCTEIRFKNKAGKFTAV